MPPQKQSHRHTSHGHVGSRFQLLLALFFHWCILQLRQCLAELVRTRCALHATTDALQFADDIINLLTPYQRTYPLQVPVATTNEEHLLYHIILVSRHIDDL